MIERELSHYLRGIPEICAIVNDDVYAGRVPDTASPEHAILIRRIAGDRTYGLFGEDTSASPVIQIDMMSRHASAESILHRLSELIRKSLNTYAAGPGKMGSMWINSLNIISEGVDVPLIAVATKHNWRRQRSFDVQIMHEQEVTLT